MTSQSDKNQREGKMPNGSETRAWRVLVELGASEIHLGNTNALDLSTIRIGSSKKLGTFLWAVREVVGRSGVHRWHVDRAGNPTTVVSDWPHVPGAPSKDVTW